MVEAQDLKRCRFRASKGGDVYNVTMSGKRIKQSRHTRRKKGTKGFEDTRKKYVTFVDKMLSLCFFVLLADFLISIEGCFSKPHVHYQT